MSASDKAWYLVQCKPKQEFIAESNFENQHIKSFLPLLSIEKIVRGKRRIVEEPTFPGYIFIQLKKNGELWSKVRSTRGVRDFVRFGGVPAAISGELLSQLEVLDNRRAENIDTKTPVEGDRIRVKSGPFKDLEGVFRMPDGEKRSIVLLRILGKLTKLDIPNTQIEKM